MKAQRNVPKRFLASLLVVALLLTIIPVPANAATASTTAAQATAVSAATVSTTTARAKAEREEAYIHELAGEYGYAIYRGEATPRTPRGEYVIRNTLKNPLVEISLIVRVTKKGSVYCTINGQSYWSRAEVEAAIGKYASKKAIRTKAEQEEKYFLKFARSNGYTATRGQTIPKTARGEYAIKNLLENKYVEISFIVRVNEKGGKYYTINGQSYWSRAAAQKALKKYANMK